MGSLTIGEFARASRLSPKALRLYDDLGLLPPARVDPATGYRFYDPDQLEHARLVAWLRRIGMPLARIREVCGLAPGAAADAVRAYWAEVEADTAARRDLAAFLIDHLSQTGKEPAIMSTGSLAIRYASLSDPGRVRESNQDSAYAGSRLLAVADGYGDRGGPAGAAAIEALKRLETGALPAGEILNALEEAVRRAADDLAEAAESGTTLTAMLLAGSQLALVHIGDSRAYLLRDGELFQITHDHTLVQSMVDDGRLTPEEAASHPQRSLLLKSLTFPSGVAPDLRLHDARPGDRYLLCSDGLSAVVPGPEVQRVISATADPEQAVRELVALANAAGGPDNVACVVADVVAQG
ncbi:MerR family transcriptional regulator [Streptomyces sp. NBC_01262]|uniref:MerR family transcriptional regulator n=1 Tax=Streptomyces sp. NBC_01262 TaxID=2903803 RepID=UPI002E3234AA|nr:MerR family transcriptional regulator [Streptomyces sp. NBC_01262]